MPAGGYHPPGEHKKGLFRLDHSDSTDHVQVKMRKIGQLIGSDHRIHDRRTIYCKG